MKVFRVLRNNRGEVYFDLLLSMGILLIVVYSLMLCFPVFVVRQNIDYMAKVLVREIEITGEKGAAFETELAKLKEQAGLDPQIIVTGNFKENKLQIKERFTVEITEVVEIVLFNVLGKELKFSIPIHKEVSGMSEVYHK